MSEFALFLVKAEIWQFRRDSRIKHKVIVEEPVKRAGAVGVS